MDTQGEGGKWGPLSLCAPGYVFLSLMVTSRLECWCCHSAHCNRGWQHGNELEAQQPCLWCNSQPHSGPSGQMPLHGPHLHVSPRQRSSSTLQRCFPHLHAPPLFFSSEGSEVSVWEVLRCAWVWILGVISQLSHSFTSWKVQNKQLSGDKQ